MEAIEIFKQKLLNKKININFDLHKKITIISLENYLIQKNNYRLWDYDIKKIIDLLTYDFSEYDIKNRLHAIKELKKDSNSKKSFIIRYGEAHGEILYNKRLNRQKITSSKSHLIEKYGEDTAQQILKLKCPNNLATLISKYGETDGTKKYEEYLKKYKRGNSLEGYIERYGGSQGTEKYNNRKNKYSYVNTLGYYKELYGEDIGTDRWMNKNKKISYKHSKQYYIDTLGEEEGNRAFKDNTWYANMRKKHGDDWFQNFLKEKNIRAKFPIKDKFIKKYGEQEGVEKYNRYIEKQKYAHTVEYFIEKYGEEIGKDEYLKSRKKLINNLLNKHNTSNISKELFCKLREKIGDDCKYSGHNKELFLYDDRMNRLLFYDFCFNNKILEFHGDFWHLDPMQYDKNFIHPILKISAKDIWNNDEYKIKLANSYNYKTKIIWENDYKKNKTQIINECINFLMYE